MGQYGPEGEARGGGYRVTLDAYAKYIFFFTWRVGAVAKAYKRKKFLFIRWWAKHRADRIVIDNIYYSDKYQVEQAERDSRTCNNSKKCKLQGEQFVGPLGEPAHQSVSSTVRATFGTQTLETSADADFGQG